MNFIQALEELKKGNKIRRSCWEDNHYWYLNNCILNSKGDKPEINKKQLESEDWEIYSEEFCLSNKDRILIPEQKGQSYYWKKEDDLKEFIKRVKKGIKEINFDKKFGHDIFAEETLKIFYDKIDKLAGDKLT